jgi:hypothetical protein
MIIYHLLDRFQPNYLNGKTRVVVKGRTLCGIPPHRGKPTLMIVLRTAVARVLKPVRNNLSGLFIESIVLAYSTVTRLFEHSIAPELQQPKIMS